MLGQELRSRGRARPTAHLSAPWAPSGQGWARISNSVSGTDLAPQGSSCERAECRELVVVTRGSPCSASGVQDFERRQKAGLWEHRGCLPRFRLNVGACPGSWVGRRPGKARRKSPEKHESPGGAGPDPQDTGGVLCCSQIKGWL